MFLCLKLKLKYMQSWPISGIPITCLNLIKPDKMLHSSILELQLSCPQFNASHILMLYLDGIRIYECFKSHSFFETYYGGFFLAYLLFHNSSFIDRL